VLGVFAAVRTILGKNKFFGGVYFVALSHVVLAFADSTDKSNNDALVFFGHTILKL
jgi:hypothetical protein